MDLDGQGKKRLLSVGAVASRAGVSADTVRLWEREGRLRAARTPGGQRRFREEDVDALLGVGEGSRPDRTEIVRPVGPVKPARSVTVAEPVDRREPAASAGPTQPPSPRRRVMEARADLEVLRARREAELLLMARRQEEAAAAQALHAEQVRAQAQLRLENLKAHGRSLATETPADWRAYVVRDLETFVTLDQFPATLTDWEAQGFIEARVQRLLQPWRDEIARQQEIERRRGCVRHLLDVGTSHARTETLSWSTEDAKAAREEVQSVLARSVTWKGTEAGVRDLVDDILDEWDDLEDGEDDEDDQPEH